MQPETPLMRQPASTTLELSQNRVLRNTYALLALSLLPTIAGAWLAVAFGLGPWFIAHRMLYMVVFLAGAFGLMFAVQANRTSGLGVGLLLAFTFFMGAMLS